MPGRRERTGGTLFDRVERPLSPESETEGGDRRRRGGASGRGRRSDITKPVPDHIDRYIPGQRDTAHRNGGRRGGGRDSRPRNAENAGRRSNARPRKTQEELDQEMEDYWGGKDAGTEAAGAQPVQDAPVAADAPAAGAAPAVTDNDIDMIE